MDGNKSKYYFFKHQAVTLVELIIVIVILPMLVYGAYAFMQHSLKTGEEQRKDVDLQYETRKALNLVDEEVKYSKAVFAVPKEKFQGGSIGMNPEWEYIGVATVGANQGELCQFKHDGTNWVETVLSDPSDDVTYELIFTPADYKSKTGEEQQQICLDYTLTPIIGGVKKTNKSISTSTEVLNAYSIGDQGTATNPSIALAFLKTDATSTTTTIGGDKVQIVFVVSVSAGMEMNYSPPHTQKDFADVSWKSWDRIHDAKKQLRKMFEEIKNAGLEAEIGGVDVRGVARTFNFTNPSDTDTYSLANLSTDASAIDSFIAENYYIWAHSSLYDNSAMSIIQGNNDGDGLRVGYNLFDPNAKKYLIFITSDATPAYRTLKSGVDNDYYYGKGMFFNTSDNHDLDSGGYLKWVYRPNYYAYSSFARLVQEPKNGYQNKEYPLKVADYFKNKYPDDLKSFIVTPGYRKGDGKWETNYFLSINAAMGNTNDEFFDASNATEFEGAMNKITETIIHIDKRFFDGP